MRTRLFVPFAVFLAISFPDFVLAAWPPYVSGRSTVQTQCGTTTVALPATWYFPNGRAPQGLAWLQHGFFRTNEDVADLASKMAGAGIVVVAMTIPSILSPCTFNNTTGFISNLADLFGAIDRPDSQLLASARAAASGAGITVPALPSRLVFSGHSAGGSAVTLVAAQYVTRFPASAERLRGLVLLDPVENLFGSMTASLPLLGALPIFTISAPPAPCNANTSGTRALQATGRPFIGFELTTGSHCDAEGASGNPVLCGLVCGAVQGLNVFLLQVFAVGWTSDLLLERATAPLYPGGSFYDGVGSAGLIRTY